MEEYRCCYHGEKTQSTVGLDTLFSLLEVKQAEGTGQKTKYMVCISST